MQVGWVKIGDFRQITGHISKTVQDRCIVSVKVVCTLSNGDIADDLECPYPPQTTPISPFCTAFRIFVMDVVRNFKCGLQVNCSKSQLVDDKSSLKGAWSGSRDTF